VSGGGSDAGRRSNEADRIASGSGAMVEVPPPLTPGQIDALSITEAQEALAKVAKARQHAEIDEETRERLEEEFDLLIARLKELKE
ncbi:MAG: hypothetical protein JSV91_08300, partial [Phycisphaerales bacterium]